MALIAQRFPCATLQSRLFGGANPQKVVSSAPDQSLRPLTQVLVGALDVALEKVFLLRSGEAGRWVKELEQLMLGRARDLKSAGVDTNAVQVAESAIRATVRSVRHGS